MKVIQQYIAGISLAVLGAGLFSSCEKTFDEKISLQSDLSNQSVMQVFLGTVGASRNYVYMDGLPLTGSLLSTGSVFPGTGYGALIPGGLRSFMVRDTLSTSTQVPLVFTQNLSAGQNYTMFVYDTITSPRQVTVPTRIVDPADTTARIRFANFVYSPVEVPAVDIFSVKRNANIFTNVPLTGVTDFIPIASALTDTFYVRTAGSGTNLQNWSATPAPGTFVNIQAVLTPTQKRSYTLIFRGGFRATTTTNTTVRSLSVMVNR